MNRREMTRYVSFYHFGGEKGADNRKVRVKPEFVLGCSESPDTWNRTRIRLYGFPGDTFLDVREDLRAVADRLNDWLLSDGRAEVTIEGPQRKPGEPTGVIEWQHDGELEVYVPEEWGCQQVEEFANQAAPSGSGWTYVREGVVSNEQMDDGPVLRMAHVRLVEAANEPT